MMNEYFTTVPMQWLTYQTEPFIEYLEILLSLSSAYATNYFSQRSQIPFNSDEQQGRPPIYIIEL